MAVGAAVISQTHARIFFDHDLGGYVLEDLHSKNGTRLDGVPVHGRRRLGDLHVVTLGKEHDLIFVTVPETDPTVEGMGHVATTDHVVLPASTSKTIYEEGFVLEMPALTDDPQPVDRADPPNADQTVAEAPLSLRVPSLEVTLDRGDESTDDTAIEPPRALTVPPLESPRHLTPSSVEQTAPTSVEPSSEAPATRAVLEVTVADGTSVRVEVGEGRHDIGRSPDCAVCVDDRTLSRVHAVLTVRPDAVMIEDRNSRNGRSWMAIG